MCEDGMYQFWPTVDVIGRGYGRCKCRPFSRCRPAKGAHAKKHKAAKMKKTSRRRNRRGV